MLDQSKQQLLNELDQQFSLYKSTFEDYDKKINYHFKTDDQEGIVKFDSLTKDQLIDELN